MEDRISVRRLNQQTAAVLAQVANGKSVTITNDGQPVARLVGIVSSPLDELVGSGQAVGRTVNGAFVLPEGTADVDVAAAMAADREAERW